MTIYCNRCSKHLGEILSGSRLRKDIVYLCKECNDRAKIAESSMKVNSKAHPDKEFENDFLKKLGFM